MNRKITRITLLILIITISTFLIISVIGNIEFITFISIYKPDTEENSTDFPLENSIYRISAIEACSCLGNVYSDTTPPVVVVKSPQNNSLILVDTIIYIECTDNFPAMDGGEPSVPEYVYYHWNNATSNTTAYDANVDGAPPNDGPVKLEFTLPTDEAGVTHVLYIYAVDYENNWNLVFFIYSTPIDSGETSVPLTTIATTIETSTNFTTVSTSSQVTTEDSSNTTTESRLSILSTINITSGFPTYLIAFTMMILLPIKRIRKRK